MPTIPDAPAGVVAIAQSLSADNLIAITRDLNLAVQRPDPHGRVVVDFSSFNSSNRTSNQWATVLSNIIASQFGSTPMSVELPTDHAARIQLARAGVYFALSRNKHLHWESLRGGNDRLLRRWQEDWKPPAVQQPLFDLDAIVDEAPTPVEVTPDIVAFLNPDRIELADSVESQKAVIYPWLSNLVGQDARGTSNLDLDLQRNISLVIWELLGNVRDHARLRSRGLCSLSAFVTDGGSGHRLHLSVADIGCGMPKSLPRHFRDPTDASDMVSAAFNGALPRHERDRGRGLNRIAELVEAKAGRLFTATGPAGGGAIVVDHHGGRGRPVTARVVPDLTVRGTVVLITLPIPRHPNSATRTSGEGS